MNTDSVISTVDKFGDIYFHMDTFVELFVYFHDRSFAPTHLNTEMWLWRCTNHIPDRFSPILTREVCRAHRVTGKGILSHTLHGIDNTGNVRVWVLLLLCYYYWYSFLLANLYDRVLFFLAFFFVYFTKVSEPLLLYTLLTSPYSSIIQDKHVLELGGGEIIIHCVGLVTVLFTRR